VEAKQHKHSCASGELPTVRRRSCPVGRVDAKAKSKRGCCDTGAEFEPEQLGGESAQPSWSTAGDHHGVTRHQADADGFDAASATNPTATDDRLRQWVAAGTQPQDELWDRIRHQISSIGRYPSPMPVPKVMRGPSMQRYEIALSSLRPEHPFATLAVPPRRSCSPSQSAMALPQ